MSDWDCSCLMDYPNENYKCKNGHWKCVDRYEFMEVSKHGYTHCKRTKERDISLYTMNKMAKELNVDGYDNAEAVFMYGLECLKSKENL